MSKAIRITGIRKPMRAVEELLGKPGRLLYPKHR
jgi:hypothetical protein